MLKLYDYFEAIMESERNKEWLFDSDSYRNRLNYFASEVMKNLEIEDDDEIASSINRAFQACSSLNIPFKRNFKKVYRSDGESVFADWKISPLACYLIVINCNPGNEHVARAQLFFALTHAENSH